MIQKMFHIKEEHEYIIDESLKYSHELLSDYLAECLPSFIKRQQFFGKGFKVIKLNVFHLEGDKAYYNNEYEFLGKYLFDLSTTQLAGYISDITVYLNELNHIIVYNKNYEDFYGIKIIKSFVKEYSNIEEMINNDNLSSLVLNKVESLIRDGIIDNFK